MKLSLPSIAAVAALCACTCSAWDYEVHRMVSQVAMASLPTNFPALELTPEIQERIAFLSGEPDRWRNTTDLPLKHYSNPDHFLDLEHLADYGLSPSNLTAFRFEFVGQLAVARATNPGNFPAIDPAKNEDRTRTLIGFLPWAMEENYAKLKSVFSCLKTFEMLGTPEEIINAQQNAVYAMGILGHLVGDAGQPLHTTKHFNGWVGDNPRGYSTNSTIHAWVDGGYIRKVGMSFDELKDRVRPARALPEAVNAPKDKGIFPLALEFVAAQNKLVETVYQLDKAGDLSDAGQADSKGRAFMAGQLLESGQLLGDLWLSAWETAPIDSYLKGRLQERNSGQKSGSGK